MIYRMKLADSVDEMTFDLLEVPIEDKDIEGATDNTTIDGNVFTDYLWLKKQFVQKWSLMCKDDYTQLRGFYTRQWENAEAPTYTLFAGENRSETLTASGSAFQIQNGTQYDAPLTLTELTGNATQNGTPAPTSKIEIDTTTGENVVKNTGKNLLSLTPYRTGGDWYNISVGAQVIPATSSDITLTPIQNGVQATLSSGWQGAWYICEVAEGQTYTFKYSQSGTNARTTTYTLDETHTIARKFAPIASDNHTCQNTITIAEGEKYFALTFGASSTGSVVELTEPQLELGSTATDYESYQGQSCPIALASKNLLPIIDGTATAYGITATIEDGVITLNGTTTSGVFVKVSNGVAISTANETSWRDDTIVDNLNGKTFSIKYLGGTYPSSGTAWRIFPNSTTYLYQWYPQNSDIVRTFTTDTAETRVLALFANNGVTFNNYKVQIQLEKGSTATSFAPYLTPIELAKIGTYQDRIYKQDGKWYIEKQTGKYTLTGGFLSAGQTSVFYSKAISDYAISSNIPYSEYFTGIANVSGAGSMSSASNNTVAFISTSGETTPRFYIKSSSFATQDELNTWLSTHPTTVYYALATPTTTEITDNTLLSQLNFIANLYGGTNNIMLVGTGAQGEIGVKYTLTYEKEQTIIPETTVRLTLTDGGVINTCECRQNVQLTMRETVQ